MKIRKSTMQDLREILKIYEYAREQMRKNGNPTQWGDSRPSVESVIKDIEDGDGYVIEEGNQLCGVFAFIIGTDPTYLDIQDGQWLNDKAYGVVHRIASNGREKGVFQKCFEYCESQVENIRVDTHRDNLIMQHLLEKNGYVRCGIIYVDDGTPRIAYQKEV